MINLFYYMLKKKSLNIQNIVEPILSVSLKENKIVLKK